MNHLIELMAESILIKLNGSPFHYKCVHICIVFDEVFSNLLIRKQNLGVIVGSVKIIFDSHVRHFVKSLRVSHVSAADVNH